MPTTALSTWDPTHDLGPCPTCATIIRYEDNGECPSCERIWCIDCKHPLDYTDERGYFHTDGTECFLHGAA
jgi:hypothetical protein